MTETIACPGGAVLDAWSDKEWNNGVQIDQMEELTTLAVQTRDSLYEITVLDGRTGDVLVRGGEFFPVRTPIRCYMAARFAGLASKARKSKMAKQRLPTFCAFQAKEILLQHLPS